MDETKEYIEMCAEAYEIQAQWQSKWNKGLGDFVYRTDEPNNERVMTVFDGTDNEYSASTNHIASHHPHINKCVWLPRQDQLQEIYQSHIISKDQLGRLSAFGLSVKIHEYSRKHIFEINSMEQLWLAFVMFERYNKVWNGAEWIRC